MRMIVLAGCAALGLLGWSPDEAKAEHRHHRGRVHVDVHVGGYGGHYGGPVVCDPPRPVYRPYCPPPVQYCPPPVVYRPCPPVYYGRPVYSGHYGGGYSGGYHGGYRGGHCDW